MEEVQAFLFSSNLAKPSLYHLLVLVHCIHVQADCIPATELDIEKAGL